MIRVLHVIENFNGQAVESWLTRVISSDYFDLDEVRSDFFLIGEGPGVQAGVVIEQGCSVFLGNAGGASLPQLASALRSHVRKTRYDIVHIHQDVLSGLFAVALLGTGVKIVTHVHNCWQKLPVGGIVKERVLTALAKWLALKLSASIVGVSEQALAKMTKGVAFRRRVDRVIYCSAKCSHAVLTETDRTRIAGEVRRRLGLSLESKLLVFLGRLDPYKNSPFILEVFSSILQKNNFEAALIIAGTGGLEPYLRDHAQRLGLEGRVRMLGWVDDAESLLLASDLILIPSLEIVGEGLGLVAVEAQRFGLPVLCSLSVPVDARLLPELFKRVSLAKGADHWAEVAVQMLRLKKPTLEKSRLAFVSSNFSCQASCGFLMELYVELLPKIQTHHKTPKK